MVCLAALAAFSLCSASAEAAVTWDRAWGKDVISDGPANTGAEICVLATDCKIGVSGTFGGEFNDVQGVASDGQNVYVLEKPFPRVSKFDSNGNFLFMWGKGVGVSPGFGTCFADCNQATSGSLAGEMSDARDIAVSPQGDVYVADFGNARIQRYDSNGNFVSMWGKDVIMGNPGADYEVCTAAMMASCKAGVVGAGPGGEFDGPNAVAVDEQGQNVYVGEESAERVERFDSSGTFARMWGKDVGGVGVNQCTDGPNCKLGAGGTLGGEFQSVVGLAADSAEVYVVEDTNQRVQRFGPDGTFIRAWGLDVGGAGVNFCTTAGTCQAGNGGQQGGELNTPGGIATDGQGNPYVADTNSNRIQKFDSSGAFQTMWGKGVAGGAGFEECTNATACVNAVTGSKGGEMISPNRLASDGNGSVFVADGGNIRVQKFLDPPPAPPTLTGSAPASPANDNAPRIQGVAPPGSTVRLFKKVCDTAIASGSAAEFASPGIQVSVPDDSTTTIVATATLGSTTSGCSTGFDYVEDSTTPDTIIDTAPAGTTPNPTPSFTFHATEPNVTFDCRFDAQAFAPCSGPGGAHTPLFPLADGAHTFEVRARDAAANADATPAQAAFTVQQKPKELPPPVRGSLVNAIPEKGTVLVKLPAGAAKAHAAASGFVPLESVGRQLPVGTTLDTTKGTVKLTAATDTTGTATQDGHFSKGLFKFTQSKKNPLTTLSMTGGSLNACSKLPRGGSKKVQVAKKRRRTLFSNVNGRFRTRGRNSTATVRGTRWTMTDTCSGTRTSVKTGSVTVRDFTLRKTKVVKAGHSYLAHAPTAKRK